MRVANHLPLSIEAFAMLALASLLIAVFHFRRIAAFAAQGRAAARPASATTAAEIGWAVAGWARRVPWRAVCFQQGLAAQMMLRRRGCAARLYYGAFHDVEGRLVAHVWVRSGETDVIGCEGADAYGLLATFPPLD